MAARRSIDANLPPAPASPNRARQVSENGIGFVLSTTVRAPHHGPPHPPSHHSPKSLCYPEFPGGPSMRTFILCLTAVAAHAATTVYQASVDQLTVVHGAAAADSAIHHNAPKSLRVEPGGQY